MYRMHIHLPDELKSQIAVAAMVAGEHKAEVVRKALQQGLKAYHPSRSSAATNLLKLSDQARNIPGKGPRDLSVNHDYYAWGGRKRARSK
ncbi:hypothetical protein HY411_00080 [Candidatus Gottesmanbacteria bacterium]|nr:hypothetical protein [Candidatus Gottesmanbacteria bacterium]